MEIDAVTHQCKEDKQVYRSRKGMVTWATSSYAVCGSDAKWDNFCNSASNELKIREDESSCVA